MAGAVLAYGIVYFWIELKAMGGVPGILAYVIYYLAGVIPSYLVCRRTDSSHLLVAVKTAILSWVFVVVTLLAFTQGSNTFFFVVLLVFLVLGGVTSAYVSLRKRLSKPLEKKGNSEQGTTP